MNELGMMQLTPRPGTRIRPEKSVKLVHCRIEALQKHGIARGAGIGPKRCVGIFHEVNHGTDIRSRDQSARRLWGRARHNDLAEMLPIPCRLRRKQVHVPAMRAQRDLGFHLRASFLCRKPQFNEPPEGLRPRRQVFLLPAPSVDALNHCSL